MEERKVPGKNELRKREPVIQVKNLYKVYRVGETKVYALNGVDFTMYRGEFCAIVGTSGSGKSTLLNMLAGLEKPTKGEIVIAGQHIEKLNENQLVAFRRERVGFIFQSYNLLGTMNAVENVALPLSFRGVPRGRRREMAEKYLKMVGLEKVGDHMPNQMSGGQQQRIAIARALVNEPNVLLLDEPLGALDLKLRKEMQQELKKIQQEVGITFIYVTHDQEEALTMSDKIVVMREGEIQQIGSPTDIYNEPVNEFVANFIGESNIIEGMMVDDYKVVFGGRRFDCVDNGFGKNEVVDVVIRPEDLDIVPRGEGKLKGVVKSVLFKGVHYETMVETKVGTEITVKMAVSNDSPVYNEAANEKMSANDFYLDMEDVEELDEATIIARADAQAWNPDEDEFISIKEVDYDIKKENGKYPVTFSTAAGTSVTVNMIVKDENRVTSTENEEEIYAMNFFKKVDEIQEAVALDTDLKTWANASAWSLEDDTAVEITDVKYDFDPETITPGIYDVTFATKGYEYKIDTTDKFEVGDEVGLTFQPEDIHIMSKNNY